MPLFTLATVTLNNAQGIEKTWNSIKKQDFKSFEWLVQDGGSSDDSVNFLSKTPAITESVKDNGIYDAMNKLIERSKGDYILFLNAGDALAAPQTLSMIEQNLKDTPDFIYGDALEEDENGYTHPKTARNHKKIALGMFTHHQAMLYRKKLIDDLKYNEDYTIAADYDFTARFLQNTETVKYINEPICIFEHGGISQQQTKLGRMEQFQIRKNLKLCSPLQNHIITTLQAINMSFRNIAPNLYWILKQR